MDGKNQHLASSRCENLGKPNHQPITRQENQRHDKKREKSDIPPTSHLCHVISEVVLKYLFFAIATKQVATYNRP
jgi:hypothetical protein